MYYINKNARDVERITYQENRNEFLRLDLNENPEGLPEIFVERVKSEITPQLLAQYPETAPFERSLAAFLGIEGDNICLTNGSAEGIRHIIEAYTSVDGEIVGVTPSYAMYQVYAEMYGRRFRAVKYNRDLTISIDYIIEAIHPDTQMLILLNPNNPIGNVYTNEEFSRILKAALDNKVTLLVDEAYMYFYNNTFIGACLEHDNVFVVRTFSKLFSLAGLRLGYVIGKPEGIRVIRHLCTPHNTNAIALLFAQRIMEDKVLLDTMIAEQLEGKAFLVEELKLRGYEIFAKEGNFIFVKTKCLDADEIVSRMHDKKILIKAYENIGDFGKCLRVSTGAKKYMQKFIDALIEIDR